MAAPKNIPSVFNDEEKKLVEQENYKDLFLGIQAALVEKYKKENISLKNNIPKLSSDNTIFGFEAEFAQSVYGRESGQVSSQSLTDEEKEKYASLEYLFHADIEKSKYYEGNDKILHDSVGYWELGTDYYDVLELATPGLFYAKVWDNTGDIPTLLAEAQNPWKRMVEIGNTWQKALYIATSDRFYSALFEDGGANKEAKNHKSPEDKTKNVGMILKMLRGPESQVEGLNLESGLVPSWGNMQEGRPSTISLTSKNFTLHPSEIPNCNYATPPTIKRDNFLEGKVQRNFVKNGVSLVAPQYNITIPATCALELVEKGCDLEASFDSKYLDALNRLHLGLRKYLKSKVGPKDAVSGFAITIIGYYLTNICGLPSQIRGDIRTQTKFDVCGSEARKNRYLQKIADFTKNNKDYEMKAWCYTHSWIKDVAHTWIKANGIITYKQTLECLNGVDKEAFNKVMWQVLESIAPSGEDEQQQFKQNLSNGDISDPLLGLAKLMDYEFPDRKFIHFVMNSEELSQSRDTIYARYKPGKPPTGDFQAPQYQESGYEQLVWAMGNAINSFKFHVLTELPSVDLNIDAHTYDKFRSITWCREDTASPFTSVQDGKDKSFYEEAKGMLVTEIRDQAYLEYLDGDVNLNKRGG